ncbi:Peptidase M8 [Trypanosoma melophagium]|uniref:Peptidase M8 n=1 Tax=Trypanosoma melophagium TaxID=715481 RepID=UPI00351A0BE8|nr:Peptidase M8 [Trypanosoma melophagium]
MDGDPIIRPLVGTACEGGDETLLPGSLFGRESRCLSAKDLVLRDPKGQKKPNIAGVCAKVKCGNDKTVSVQLKGYEQNDKQWHECSGDKATVELDGSVFSNGTIECPKYEEVCTGLPKTETLTIKFYNGPQGGDVYDTVVKEDEDEEEEQTNTEHTPVSPAPNPDDNVEKEVNVPTVNEKNGTQTDTKPESTVDTLPQVPPNTSVEVKEEKEEEKDDDDDNETTVTPSGDATISSTTEEDNVSQSADTATVPSDESHDNVSDNSNTSVIPPHNMDSSQKEDSSKPGNAPETKDSQHHEKTPQDEAPQEEEIPPKEGESSKSESPDNNNTGSLANEQGDHNTEKDTDYSEVESSKNPTGVSSGKDSDSSIAISFFGPLMLLVCAVAAVGAL